MKKKRPLSSVATRTIANLEKETNEQKKNACNNASVNDSQNNTEVDSNDDNADAACSQTDLACQTSCSPALKHNDPDTECSGEECQVPAQSVSILFISLFVLFVFFQLISIIQSSAV